MKHRFFIFFFVTFLSFLPVFAQVENGENNAEESETEEAESDDEISPTWEIAAGAKYLGKNISYGVDLSKGQPLFGLNADVEHQSGFSFGLGGTKISGQNGLFQQLSLSLGYQKEVNDWLDIHASYSYTHYSDDTLHVLANAPSNLTVGADFTAGMTFLGLSLARFFGTSSAYYLSADISTIIAVGDLRILPMAGVTVASQNIVKKNSTNGKSKLVTGLSEIQATLLLLYPLGKGFSLSLSPGYAYSPKSDLAQKSSQFLLSGGIRYSLEIP